MLVRVLFANFNYQIYFVFVYFVYSLRITLFNDSAEVRAATLRAIRYFVQSKQTLRTLLSLNIQHLIARSLDLVLENRIERIQALRLLRHTLAIEPNLFPLALGRCLCSIANDNSLEKDILLRACWATIAELTTVNAVISARSGCISVVIKCALNSAVGSTANSSSNANEMCVGRDFNRNQHNNNSMNNAGSIISGGTLTNLTIPYTNVVISEAILSSFLYLYNWPETRKLLKPNGSDLFYFVSPFTDVFSFLHSSNAALKQSKYVNQYVDDPREDPKLFEIKDIRNLLFENKPIKPQQQYANYEHRTLRYLACKNAIVSILRSWPGMFFMCRVMETSDNQDSPAQNPSPSLYEYSDAYKKLGNEANRSFMESLKFFGVEGELIPKKMNLMVRSVENALDMYSESSSSFFTSASFDSLNPLESLISIFHLPYPEVHRHLLEMFYELFGMKVHKWYEKFDESLKCVYYTLLCKKLNSFKSSSNFDQQIKDCFPEEWQLYDGFVVKEAEYVLPSRSTNRLNFINNYYALLLQSLVEFGLLEGLISVILDSNDICAVNAATILIGEMLHISGMYLPPSIYAHRCQSLPSLVAASMSDCKKRRNRALNAITNLDRIHNLKKRGLQPTSLFLQQQLHFCRENSIKNKPKLRNSQLSKAQDDNVITMIKNSNVLRKNSFKEWSWDLISDLLRHPSDVMHKLEEKDVCSFVKRLLEFFCPSRRQFSLISKNSSFNGTDPMSVNQSSSGRNEVLYFENPQFLCMVAVYFVDFLLNADPQHSNEFVKEFISDLELCFKNIAVKNPSGDEILIPSRLLSTLSHQYFLLVGRFTFSPVGRCWIENKTNIFHYLLDIISLSTNDIYMKLIVSSLDYSESSFSRPLLSKVLTSTLEASRLYATQYFRVLLRAGAPKFTDWAIEYLVLQLYDQSTAVSLTALDILDEACSESSQCLEKLISYRPAILQLGDLGIIFFTRFASSQFGLNHLYETNMLSNELERWKSHFCFRYVKIVEDLLNECFSCHQKSSSGKYGRRSDKRHFPYPKHILMTAYLPAHLYGQLVQTFDGLQIVRQSGLLDELCNEVKMHFDFYIENDFESSSCIDDATTLKMKAAIWAIGHMATSEAGLNYIIESEQPFLYWITSLVKRSLVLSLRATCFYSLCLISSTPKGSDLLAEYGWISIQHSDNDMFPINQQEYDSFYYDCRPRFMSDPEKHTPTFVSIPSSSFILSTENPTMSTSTNPHLSRSSSRSSSSSYLSMAPSGVTPKQNAEIDKVKIDDRRPSFTISSSSSATSIYSNTSYIGCLVSSNVASLINSSNRPRSSSDCLTTTSTIPEISPIKLADSKMNAKPECQDSGIMELSTESAHKAGKIELNSKPARNRKISAPCFAVTSNVNRENRSDSNDSARTNTTNTTSITGVGSSVGGSRSTSFADYSTSCSSAALIESNKSERNVSFVDDLSSKGFLYTVEVSSHFSNSSTNSIKSEQRHKTSKSKRHVSIVVDDPYPSPVDAHGYAQLRAIQKRRVQSLSGNMFFSGVKTQDFSTPYSYESDVPKSPKPINHSISNLIKSEECMPDIFNESIQSMAKQRKSLGLNMLDVGEARSLIRNTSLNTLFDDNSGMHKLDNTLPRSTSRVSKSSYSTDDTDILANLDEVVSGIDDTSYQTLSKKFMSLCLPQSLSLMFELEEVTKSYNSLCIEICFKN